MEENRKFLEFEITIKEKTGWGITNKTFKNYILNPSRVSVFVDLINYISEKYPEDYHKAVKILREQRQ